MGERKRKLHRRLRSLRERAEMARRAAGKPFSQLHALTPAVRKLPGGRDFEGKRASAWAPQALEKFNVPHSGSDPAVLALVEVWTRWAGDRPNREEWQRLLKEAREEQHAERGGSAARVSSTAGAAGAADPTGVTAVFRPGPGSSAHRVPGGLPPLSPNYTGHGRVLSALLDALAPSERPVAPGSARVSVMTGMPGSGKTEVALQAAHAGASRGWFPGGVLFADLNGYDAEPR